jgi:hypothetical protein
MPEFLSSNEVAQIECFWEAELVGVRKEGAYMMICKQHEYFYIEYKVKHEMYVGMRVFKNPDLLQPYLEQMEIKLPA